MSCKRLQIKIRKPQSVSGGNIYFILWVCGELCGIGPVLFYTYTKCFIWFLYITTTVLVLVLVFVYCMNNVRLFSSTRSRHNNEIKRILYMYIKTFSILNDFNTNIKYYTAKFFKAIRNVLFFKILHRIL